MVLHALINLSWKQLDLKKGIFLLVHQKYSQMVLKNQLSCQLWTCQYPLRSQDTGDWW